MFWLTLFCFVVAAGAALALMLSADKRVPGGVLASFLAAGLVFMFASMISFVETKNVGIVKSFNKPTGRTTGAGMQWTKPWEGIDDWDATRQSFNYLGAKCEKPGDGSLWVQIAGQRNMCVRVQVNYDTATGKRATENWAAYRDREGMTRFESFVAMQVTPGISDAVLATFREFDPLNLIDKNTGEMIAPDLSGTYTAKLREQVSLRLGSDINVVGITWGLVGFDAATTALISERGQKTLEKGNLAIDAQNAVTRRTIAGNTGVPAAVQQCLDLVKSLGKGEPGLCMGAGVTLTRPIGAQE